MTVLYKLHQQLKESPFGGDASRQQRMQEYRAKARSLMTFAGMVRRSGLYFGGRDADRYPVPCMRAAAVPPVERHVFAAHPPRRLYQLGAMAAGLHNRSANCPLHRIRRFQYVIRWEFARVSLSLGCGRRVRVSRSVSSAPSGQVLRASLSGLPPSTLRSSLFPKLSPVLCLPALALLRALHRPLHRPSARLLSPPLSQVRPRNTANKATTAVYSPLHHLSRPRRP